MTFARFDTQKLTIMHYCCKRMDDSYGCIDGDKVSRQKDIFYMVIVKIKGLL